MFEGTSRQSKVRTLSVWNCWMGQFKNIQRRIYSSPLRLLQRKHLDDQNAVRQRSRHVLKKPTWIKRIAYCSLGRLANQFVLLQDLEYGSILQRQKKLNSSSLGLLLQFRSCLGVPVGVVRQRQTQFEGPRWVHTYPLDSQKFRLDQNRKTFESSTDERGNQRYQRQ